MDDATTSAPRTSAPAGLGGDSPPADLVPAAGWGSLANPRRTTL